MIFQIVTFSPQLWQYFASLNSWKDFPFSEEYIIAAYLENTLSWTIKGSAEGSSMCSGDETSTGTGDSKIKYIAWKLYWRLLEGRWKYFYVKFSSYLSHCSLLGHCNSAATRFKINMVHHLTLSVRPVIIVSTRQYFLTPISPHFINVTESNESWNS